MLDIERIRWGSHLMLIVSSNDKGHFKGHRTRWNPEENVKPLQLGLGNNNAERNYITVKHHLMLCVNFFNNNQLLR